METNLDVVQPWSQIFDTLFTMGYIPDGKIERARREKALMSDIVLFLCVCTCG